MRLPPARSCTAIQWRRCLLYRPRKPGHSLTWSKRCHTPTKSANSLLSSSSNLHSPTRPPDVILPQTGLSLFCRPVRSCLGPSPLCYPMPNAMSHGCRWTMNGMHVQSGRLLMHLRARAPVPSAPTERWAGCHYRICNGGVELEKFSPLQFCSSFLPCPSLFALASPHHLPLFVLHRYFDYEPWLNPGRPTPYLDKSTTTSSCPTHPRPHVGL